MKKVLLILMFVVSMVSFSNKVNQTKKYTLVKITETPHGG